MIPSIESILAASPQAELTLLTPEVEPMKAAVDGKKYHHYPIRMQAGKGLLSRIQNFITYVQVIGRLIKNGPADTAIWARSSPAGIYAYTAWWLWKVPFVVESFEPHADYMVEGGTWKKGGLKATVQRWFEKKQVQHARVLATVSVHFREKLVQMGRDPSTVFNIPCGTDFSKFAFKEEVRERTRSKLFGPQHASLNVAIYVGKFGDIYYDDPFFDWVKKQVLEDPMFKLIILSPMKAHASKQLSKRGVDSSTYHLDTVDHHEVPDYLCAADVGLCFVQQSPSRLYCSPIKVGEYLACGLPVYISKGIGEDSDWIEKHGAGGVIDFEGMKPSLSMRTIDNARRLALRDNAQTWKDHTAYIGQYREMIKRLKP